MIDVCLNSRCPFAIYWGAEFVMLYNDDLIPMVGANKHPQAFGRPAFEVLPEIRDIIEPLLLKVMTTGEGLAKHGIYRVCRLAELPERSWHLLRHSYATHAALLGVNPLRLQNWLRHSTLTMNLRYVHFAEAHGWPIADGLLMAGAEIVIRKGETRRAVGGFLS